MLARMASDPDSWRHGRMRRVTSGRGGPRQSGPPCPTCPIGRCTCPTAEAFAARARSAIPHEIDSGRLCGGRALLQDEMRRVAESPEMVMRLREYADRLRARRIALQLDQSARDEERRRVTLHLDILDHWVCAGEPEGVAELGRRHGHKHCWAVELRKRIVAEAYDLGERGRRAVIAVACGCRCGGVVTRWAGTGRPARYLDDTHRERARARRKRARRAKSEKSPETVPGKPVESQGTWARETRDR